MTIELGNTEIRELSADELVAVSGGRQYCAYEAANKCYAWRDETLVEMVFSYLNAVAASGGYAPPLGVPTH